MATLGAVLGCGRHLASTVVTGSVQWSSTLLAELRLSTVFVLALRAFHCRPRRKKRARWSCEGNVTHGRRFAFFVWGTRPASPAAAHAPPSATPPPRRRAA